MLYSLGVTMVYGFVCRIKMSVIRYRMVNSNHGLQVLFTASNFSTVTSHRHARNVQSLMFRQKEF